MNPIDTQAPNRLGAFLRYFTAAWSFARDDHHKSAPTPAGKPLLFRSELAELARTTPPAADPLDTSALWSLAAASPWLGPNIQIISNRLIAVPLAVKHRQDERLEDIPNHPIERLLASPNPIWPGALVWQYGITWRLLRGNAYWFLATPSPGQGLPQEIWALESSHVLPKPDTLHHGRGVFANTPIIDYELTIQGRAYPLPGENVIHWRTPNPFDYWEGLSPLVAAQLGLRIDHAQAAWLQGFYGEDNAIPTAVISLPPTIDDSTFDAAKQEIREQFGQKRRSAITRAGDLSIEVIDQALKDMEMVSSREFNGKLLDRIYSIPEGLISGGLSGDSRLAAETTFIRNTIQPLLVSFASALDARLTPYWSDPDLILVAPDITPQDRALDLQEFTLQSPFLTVNEARERIGKPTYTHHLADIPLRLLDLLAQETQGDAETPASSAHSSPAAPPPSPPSLPGADAPANIVNREAQKTDVRAWSPRPSPRPFDAPAPPESAIIQRVIAEMIKAAHVLETARAATTDPVLDRLENR